MLVVTLARVPGVRGIYGPTKDQLPDRMALAAPDAAASILELVAESHGALGLSDLYRTGDSSLLAMSEKRGVLPPAYSGHNFGLSLDADVDGTCKRMGVAYPDFLDWMAARGWHCHRRDRLRGPEDWHFNWLGAPEEAARYLSYCDDRHASWQAAIEARIVDRYGDAFHLTAVDVQACLKKLGLYGGDLDGQLGPLCRQAFAAFSRAWHLDPETNGERFHRTLAFVAAEIKVMDLAAPAPVNGAAA